jgi:hypothetical protein
VLGSSQLAGWAKTDTAIELVLVAVRVGHVGSS